MRVKLGDTWYDAEEQPICVELRGGDKDNIANMLPDCDKYAIFPDSAGMTPDEMRQWMAEGSRAKENE